MTLWGGRFEGSPAQALWRFTVDTSDRRLLVDDVVGSLRLGVIPTMAPYLLPTVVREICRRYPLAELTLVESKTADLCDQLATGELDLGLLATPVPEIGPAMTTADLAHAPFVLALPVGHPFAGRSRLPQSALSSLPMLLLEEGHCLRSHAQAACSAIGASTQSTTQATSLPAACQMVAAGMGVTLLPASAIEVEARAGSGITVRRVRRPEPFRTISLVWRSRAGRSERYAQLADALAEPVRSACTLRA